MASLIGLSHHATTHKAQSARPERHPDDKEAHVRALLPQSTVADVVAKHRWERVLPSLVYADGYCVFSCAA
jgi:hypothetical protein